ncbi:prune homolog 2 [Mytilus galloprovincialis]|uniref:Prune homolog 2 n=1 Tax=Mytilus galloprovincialis TaxID=29158 RepID=A0A8B6D4E9_MYTGA|nr:prune homolog 2 [Mytilus galloprovincialis]
MEESNEPTMDHSIEPKMVEFYEPKMEESDEPKMEDSNEPKMEELDEPKMVESNEPNTEESSEPEIIEPNELKMEESNEPMMEELDEPKMVESNEPNTEESSEPEIIEPNELKMEESNEPMMEELDEPKMVESNEPTTKESSEPEIIEPNEPKMEEPNEPKMEESNEPKIEDPLEPNMDHSYEPEMKESDEMEDSNEPEIDHSNELKMEESNEPEMVKSNEPKLEEPNGAIDDYAAELIQHVISGAIVTVTTATNTVTKDIVSDSSSDITEESGVTWSRETSFDTVSSIPSKDGQTVIWSNQGSLDTPRSSIDKNSGAASLESDEMLLLAQSAKNGQMSSFETQESNDYLSSTSSSKLSSDSKIESSDKMEENFARDLNIDVGNENESDTLLDFSAGSNLDQHEGNQINNQTLLDFEGSELIQYESLKSEDALNELSNLSDKTAVGIESIEKMESVDMSSENEVENVLTLKSDNAFDELSNIYDKPAIGTENLDKMESVEMTSEKEAENLSPLKSENAFDELSNIFDKPAVGIENEDKTESVDRSSENEAENLSPLKSDNAFDELSNIFDKPAVGIENEYKTESVDISSENEAENLSPLKSENAFDELSNIFDKPAVGIENEYKTESVDISSENEAENLSPLKSDNAFDELSSTFDKPAVGIENEYKTESVDISSENEAENLSPLKSDNAFDELNNAFDELSNIFDKPAVEIENEDQTESVDRSSENEAENLLPLKSDNAFDELSNIFDKPAVEIENEDKTESVDRSSENEAENLLPLKSDNAFDELSDIFNKPAIGIENGDKTESVDHTSSENEAENLSLLKSENEAENMLPLKSEDALNEQSSISDKVSIGIENIDKMESLEISSENEAENMSPLKSENIDFLEQSQDSVPYSDRKKESLDYISSEGETENYGKLQDESEASTQDARSTYHKADTLDYISSEGEGNDTEFVTTLQGMYSSQSSEPTSTTTEGSYQVLSPDQQIKDIKEEITDLINSEIKGEVTDMISDIKMELSGLHPDVFETKANENIEFYAEVTEIDENKTDLNKHDEEFISNEDFLAGVSEHSELVGDNLDFSNISSNEPVSEGKEIDENKTETDLKKYDEEFISNENLLGTVAEDELKGNNADFSKISSNELVGEGNKIDESETDLNTQDKEVINNENLLCGADEGLKEEHVELKGDNLEFTNNSSNEFVGDGNETHENESKTDFNKQDEEVISNESLLDGAAEGLNVEHVELKGDNLTFTNNSVHELVCEVNEKDLDIQDEEFMSNANLLGAEVDSHKQINGDLQGNDFEFSNDSSNEPVGDENEIGETVTDLNTHDEELTSNGNLLGAEAEDLIQAHDELKGISLEFSNDSLNEFIYEGNKIDENETKTDLNKQDEEVISNENLLDGAAEGLNVEHVELKGENLEFTNNSSNELVVGEGNEKDLDIQDEEFMSNANLLGAEVDGHNRIKGKLQGNDLEYSNNSSNDFVCEGNKIDETKTDLNNQDTEVNSNENTLGAGVDGFNEEHVEIKGDNLDFSNNLVHEFVGEGNEISKKEINLNEHDEELSSNKNLLAGVAEGSKIVHDDLKGDNLEFSNNSSNELNENETKTALNKHDEESISKDNLLGAKTEGSYKEDDGLKGDNIEDSNNSFNNSHTKISETFVNDENGINTNENGAIDSIKRTKEIYMTSAGRISIASDGDSENTKQRFSVTDNFIEETHNEEDLKETRVETVDNQFKSVENEPETVIKEPENISVETESQTQEPAGTSEELVNKTQEPVSKLEESENKTQEPVSKLEEPENKTEESVSKVEEPSVKQQEKTDDGTEKPKVVKPVKKGMDMTEEWHEDPIPGMGVAADNDSDSSDSRSRHSSGDSDSSDSTRPANRPTSLQTTRKKKKISANFNILKEDYASPDDIDTTDNPGDLEWENDTPVSIPKEPIAEYSAEDEYQDAKHWRGVEINGKQQKIDLKVIDPYKKVLTHGGYYGDGLNAIIVFSGCYLPDRSRKDYNYVMDNLFLYVISTLELLVAEDYMIVYFHGATPRRQMPSFGWLKKCYQMIDRRLKKNLKGLLLIHPTLWLRTIVLMTKPFISSKFSSKLKFVRTLQDLSNIVPVDYIYIPDEVKKYDSLLQHRSPAHSSSSSTPHTPS